MMVMVMVMLASKNYPLHVIHPFDSFIHVIYEIQRDILKLPTAISQHL